MINKLISLNSLRGLALLISICNENEAELFINSYLENLISICAFRLRVTLIFSACYRVVVETSYLN